MKPNVVLLSRNASSNTPSKIRLLLYLYVLILKWKLPRFQVMRYTPIKILELVAHLYTNALLESCTMMQPEISVLSALSLSGRKSQGTSASKAFTTDPLKTAILITLPRLIDIHVYKHVCHLIGALPPSIHESDWRILSRKTSQDWELLLKPVLLRSVFNILLCI